MCVLNDFLTYSTICKMSALLHVHVSVCMHLQCNGWRAEMGSKPQWAKQKVPNNYHLPQHLNLSNHSTALLSLTLLFLCVTLPVFYVTHFFPAVFLSPPSFNFVNFSVSWYSFIYFSPFVSLSLVCGSTWLPSSFQSLSAYGLVFIAVRNDTTAVVVESFVSFCQKEHIKFVDS